ncbi:MAG: TatD family hydrolase [Patescibacteria group bacterium]
MKLVDTHCHIQSIGLSKGERVTRELWAEAKGLTRDRAVAEADKAGVTRLLCVGCDLEDSRLAVDFVQEHEQCWASIGIHPHEAKLYAGQKDQLEAFAALVDRPKVVAIGECGFDFHYNHSPKPEQTEVLRFQIELALKHNLPIIFHVRDALDDFWPVFDSYSGIRGVLHSFTDSPENAAKALERGLYIGVNGIATFTKNASQLEVYRTIPLHNLLLETDSPFLTPAPYRGSINEPKRLGAVADFLAELRGESREELTKTTTGNAKKLFGI